MVVGKDVQAGWQKKHAATLANRALSKNKDKIKDLKRKREVIKKYIENIEVQWGEKSRQHTIIMTMKIFVVLNGRHTISVKL